MTSCNMEDFILTRPVIDYAEQIAEYREAFLETGDHMDGCGLLRRYEDPIEYIQVCLDREDPEKIPPNIIPAVQLHFIRKRDNALVGMLQIRNSENEYVQKFTGNIGYSIKPGERRKGYAKCMLKMGLAYCREMGMEKVLVCCATDNPGSERTILANGGIYESTVHEPKANIDLKRFWISL